MTGDERQGKRARARSFGRERGPYMGLVGSGFVLAGFALAALGVATSMTPSPHPLAGQAAWVLGRLGVDLGHLLMAGAALVVGGVLLLAQRSFSRLIGLDRETAFALDDLVRATTNQAGAVEGLERLVATLRTEVADAHAVLRDQAEVIKQHNEQDPLFRLAASLDQLGARIDRTIVSARDFVVGEVHHCAAPAFDEGPLVAGVDGVRTELAEVGARLAELERALAHALEPLSHDAPRAALAIDRDGPRREFERVDDVGGEYDAYDQGAPYDEGAEEGDHDGPGGPVRGGVHGGGVGQTFGTFGRHPRADEDADEPQGWRAAAQGTGPTGAPWGGPPPVPTPWELQDEPEQAPLRSLSAERGSTAHGDAVQGHGTSPSTGEPVPPLPSLTLARSAPREDLRTPELAIEVELDRAFVDASEDHVPAPLPTERPEGLDLLERLDSSRPLYVEAAEEAPPLFPDLELHLPREAAEDEQR